MNKKILMAEVLLAFLLVAAFRLKTNTDGEHLRLVDRKEVYQNRLVLHCSPDWNLLDADSLAAGIGPLPGIGNYQWKISTKSDSAAFYFNQGINLYYAFHIIESMASFKKAAIFDDKAPMIYWAQALAYGPNINDFQYSAAPDAYEAARKAESLSADCSKEEKLLIEAMSVRYSLDTSKKQSALNSLYTAKMKMASELSPRNKDIAILYADAMMLEHPWDYWKHDGTPQPWTPAIIELLEKELKLDETHPGANHYYIHMVEASPNPGKGLACANRLGKLMPGVSHVVHMPSHIYIRTGNYRQGIVVNESAVKEYNRYLKLYPDVVNNAPLYLIHNLHMQTANAMMLDDYKSSIKAADATQASFDSSFMSIPAPIGNFIQYVYLTPAFVMVRYGKWDEVLKLPAIPDSYVDANALWHWARGMAMVGKNNLAGAKNELALLKEKMKDPSMSVVYSPFNSALDAAKVAENILAGRIAEKENKEADAVAYFKEAVKAEDAMIYNEPRDWLLPARQYLGNALLNGNYSEAERIFHEDLDQNPRNNWSLYGLYLALKKEGRTKTPLMRAGKRFRPANMQAENAVF